MAPQVDEVARADREFEVGEDAAARSELFTPGPGNGRHRACRDDVVVGLMFGKPEFPVERGESGPVPDRGEPLPRKCNQVGVDIDGEHVALT